MSLTRILSLLRCCVPGWTAHVGVKSPRCRTRSISSGDDRNSNTTLTGTCSLLSQTDRIDSPSDVTCNASPGVDLTEVATAGRDREEKHASGSPSFGDMDHKSFSTINNNRDNNDNFQSDISNSKTFLVVPRVSKRGASSRVATTVLEQTPAAPSLTTPMLMDGLTSLLAEMCEKNERLYETRPRTITRFNSAHLPSVSIQDFTVRIRSYSTCSDSCFILAVMFMDRAQSGSFIVDKLNVHRLLITCVMVAAKFMDDRFQVNSVFAEIGGLPMSEMNELEIELLNLLDFVLMVDVSQYDLYARALERRAVLIQTRKSRQEACVDQLQSSILSENRGESACAQASIAITTPLSNSTPDPIPV